jgi:phage terminase small subunit
MTALSPKIKRFVAEYLIDLNATQAAIRAGYSPKTAKAQGSRLLTKADVQHAIGAGSGKRLITAEVSAERVLRELQRIAFSDLRTYFDGDHLRQVSELDADEAAAIAGFEVIIKNVAAGDGQVDTIHKFKLCDKVKALEILEKYRQLFADIVRHEGKVTLESLVAGSMGGESAE